MENLKINIAFEKGEDLLRVAQEELFRPEEDVVPYMVYQKAKLATCEFLIGYLTHNGLDAISVDLEVLLNQCREINENFFGLNVEPLTKVGKSEDVWVSLPAAKEFVAIAESSKSMVIRELV